MLNKTASLFFSLIILVPVDNSFVLAANVDDSEQLLQPMTSHIKPGKSYAAKSKRAYFSLRYGRTIVTDNGIAPGFEIDDHIGQELLATQIGFDLTEHISIEMAVDGYEMDINETGVGKVLEYANYQIVPQIRLRYPMQNNRVSPYLLGGVGLGFTESNDRTALGGDIPLGFGVPANPTRQRFSGSDTSVVYTIGAGVEYFVADNIAVGLEAKYAFQDASVTVDGQEREVNLDSFSISGGVRFLFPGPSRPTSAYSHMKGDGWLHIDPNALTPYFGFRVGAAVIAEEQLTPVFELSQNEREQVINLTFGLELNPYMSAEFAIDHFGSDVDHSSLGEVGKVTEVNISSFVPQLRAQYPLLNDKLLPYVLGGVGLGVVGTNDRTALGASTLIPQFNVDDYSLISSLGAGLEYFIADNMTVGIEAKYLFHSPEITVDSITSKVDMDRVTVSAGMRVFF